MKNKAIKEVIKIIDKLDKEDSETLIKYVSETECSIKNLSDDLLHFLEKSKVEEDPDKQKLKDTTEEFNNAKTNYEAIEEYKLLKQQKEKEAN